MLGIESLAILALLQYPRLSVTLRALEWPPDQVHYLFLFLEHLGAARTRWRERSVIHDPFP